jgi:ribosomal-protein-alanine N-acetyltransferase
MIERETHSVVGDVGFMGRPDDGIVEIGFSVIPDRHRRGYATEAACALLDWALREPGIEGVIVRCDAGNEASIRVLERVGFTRAGDADGQIRWHVGVTREG